jgi:hypothetical protein
MQTGKWPRPSRSYPSLISTENAPAPSEVADELELGGGVARSPIHGDDAGDAELTDDAEVPAEIRHADLDRLLPAGPAARRVVREPAVMFDRPEGRHQHDRARAQAAERQTMSAPVSRG